MLSDYQFWSTLEIEVLLRCESLRFPLPYFLASSHSGPQLFLLQQHAVAVAHMAAAVWEAVQCGEFPAAVTEAAAFV